MEIDSHLAIHWKSEPFNLGQLPEVAARLLLELHAVLDSSAGKFPRGVVALQGEMGAGKTTLVQALCRAWGFEQQAVSPTFGLVQQYQLQEQTIYHMDLYRLNSEEEAWDLGLTEYLDAEALNFVEWPEQAPGLLPKESVLLQVQVDGPQHEGLRKLILTVPA